MSGFDTDGRLEELRLLLESARAAPAETKPQLAGEIHTLLRRLRDFGDRPVVASALRVHLDVKAFDGLVDAEGQDTHTAALECLVTTGFKRGQAPALRPEPAAEHDPQEQALQKRALIASLVVFAVGAGEIVFRFVFRADTFDAWLMRQEFRLDLGIMLVGGWGLVGDRVMKTEKESWFGPSIRTHLSALGWGLALGGVIVSASTTLNGWLMAATGLGLVLALWKPGWWRRPG